MLVLHMVLSLHDDRLISIDYSMHVGTRTSLKITGCSSLDVVLDASFLVQLLKHLSSNAVLGHALCVHSQEQGGIPLLQQLTPLPTSPRSCSPVPRGSPPRPEWALGFQTLRSDVSAR